MSFCYRDQTFCTTSRQCGNKSCWRNYTEEVEAEAKYWAINASLDTVPIAWGDCKDTELCEGFVKND